MKPSAIKSAVIVLLLGFGATSSPLAIAVIPGISPEAVLDLAALAIKVAEESKLKLLILTPNEILEHGGPAEELLAFLEKVAIRPSRTVPLALIEDISPHVAWIVGEGLEVAPRVGKVVYLEADKAKVAAEIVEAILEIEGRRIERSFHTIVDAAETLRIKKSSYIYIVSECRVGPVVLDSGKEFKLIHEGDGFVVYEGKIREGYIKFSSFGTAYLIFAAGLQKLWVIILFPLLGFAFAVIVMVFFKKKAKSLKSRILVEFPGSSEVIKIPKKGLLIGRGEESDLLVPDTNLPEAPFIRITPTKGGALVQVLLTGLSLKHNGTETYESEIKLRPSDYLEIEDFKITLI